MKKCLFKSTQVWVASVVCGLGLAGRAEIILVDVPVGDGPGVPPPPVVVVPPPVGSSTSNTAASVAAPNLPDILEFISKDRLRGSLVSIQPSAHGLRWKHEYAAKDIDFGMGGLARVTLGRAPARAAVDHARGGARARLTNQDEVQGKLISLNDSTLVMETAAAGRMEIQRSMLTTLQPNVGASEVVYEGPNDLAEWTVGRMGGNVEAWRFKDGMLLNQYPATLGRQIDNMPDSVNIQFDLAWRRYPNFQVFFFTDELQRYNGNAYMMQVSGSSFYLHRVSRDGNTRQLGNQNHDRLGNGTVSRGRFNILVDKATKTIVVLMDGQVIKQVEDAEPFAGNGKGLMFLSQDNAGFRISNIRVSRWNGELPGPRPGAAEAKEDFVRLVNGDKVSGRLISIEAGKVKFETSFAALEVPVERVSDIELSQERRAEPRRTKDDVRALLVDGGSLTLALESLGAEKMAGASESFGKVSVDMKRVRRIEFNIHREMPKEEDGDDFNF